MSETHAYPVGDYAIVELFGHTTMIGRISEVERFGTKMLAIEPLFADVLLPVVLHGGAAIYRLTPCSAEVAFKEQPRHGWQLPPSVQKIVPLAMIADQKETIILDADQTFDPDDDPAMHDDPEV